MFDADMQHRLDETRAKLLEVERLLNEVCEIASNENGYVVSTYLAEAFEDCNAIQHSLDEVAYVFGLAASVKYSEWKERMNE